MCERCMGYYAKLLLVCRLRLCNPLTVFEVDSCIVLKSWPFSKRVLKLVLSLDKAFLGYHVAFFVNQETLQ